MINTLASPLRNLSIIVSRCEPSIPPVRDATVWPSAVMRFSISLADARVYKLLESQAKGHFIGRRRPTLTKIIDDPTVRRP